MKTLLSIVFLIIALGCRSQSGIKIIYKFTAPVGHVKSCLVCNDSGCFYYLYGGRKDPMKDSIDYGRKVMHHANYYDAVSLHNENFVDFPAGDPFIITDTVISGEWQLTNNEKNIKGYPCKKAVRINADSSVTTVWYTTAFGKSYPYPYYEGVPGIPLQITDVRYNWSVKAVSVSKGDYKIHPPLLKKRMSAEEYRKSKQSN